MRIHILQLFGFVLAAILLTAAAAASHAQSDHPGRKLAILIGVEGYERLTRLPGAANDVQQLALTLHQRGGYREKDILEITDRGGDAAHRPLAATLRDQLAAKLTGMSAQDQVLIYFSGHGLKSGDGKLFLGPIDFDPARVEASGLSVNWVREQLGACRAGLKLLVLDTCHAGTEKGADEAVAPTADVSVASEELGAIFGDLDVVTLASSTAGQSSYLWAARRQSIFGYWFNQALRGHADRDGDEAITIDELYEFVHERVKHTASIRFGHEQEPVRIVRSGVLGIPTVLKLSPRSLEQTMSDMAEQLASILDERRLPSVGVLEFTNQTPGGELLGAKYGLLGRQFSQGLEDELRKRSDDLALRVEDQRRLMSALAARQFRIDDLGSGTSLAALAREASGIKAIVVGTIELRAGRRISFRAKLLDIGGDVVAGSAGGVAILSDAQWAMLGHSAIVQAADRRVEPGPQGRLGPPVEDQIVSRLDERALAPHPLIEKDAGPPYRIRLMVGGKEVKPVIVGNDAYVGLNRGDVYEIWIENRTSPPVPVFVVLLVDGLNTQVEKVAAGERVQDPQKAVAKGLETWEWGRRVNIDGARPHLLDPANPATRAGRRHPTWAVRGFYTHVGEQGRLREFTVVDAAESLAARKQFTDQIGLITAAFFAEAPGRRGVGTAAGRLRYERIKERYDVEMGNFLGVMHLRYCEPQAIPKSLPAERAGQGN